MYKKIRFLGGMLHDCIQDVAEGMTYIEAKDLNGENSDDIYLLYSFEGQKKRFFVGIPADVDVDTVLTKLFYGDNNDSNDN